MQFIMKTCLTHCCCAGLLALLAAPAALAQSVGIGTATPDAKAALEIRATDRGLLIPRLTGGHQPINARVLGRAGAVRVVTESKLTADLLVAEIRMLLDDGAARDKLTTALEAFAVRDGARRVGRLIQAAARGDRR